MKINKCTILVNSCDSYEDTWNPFFKLLKKYWPDCKYPIVLNTESKKYKFEDLNITTINVEDKYRDKNISWSKRLKNVLNKIDSKYILFMMDDFFLMDYVESNRVEEVINWMEQDNNIAVFSFFRVEDEKHKDVESIKYPHYFLRDKFGSYRYNCQAAIWNKEELIKSLRDFESAWDWEINGNIRSYRSKKEFYTLMDPKYYIFNYNCEDYGVVRGKWRLPETAELFEKEGIEIDFNIRNNKESKKRPGFFKRKINIIKYYINKVRSIF